MAALGEAGMISRFAARWGTPPRRLAALALGLCVAMATLAVFAELAENVYERETIRLDRNANDFLHRFASPGMDALMHGVSFLGTWPVLLTLVVAVCVRLIGRQRRREALYLVVAVLGGAVLNAGLKLFFQRPRPVLPWSITETGYSFPSGHATTSMVAYASLAIVLWIVRGPRVGVSATVLAALLVLAIGLSRVYLGVHYPSDVIAGYCAGVCWLLIAALAIEGGRRTVARRVRVRSCQMMAGDDGTMIRERTRAR